MFATEKDISRFTVLTKLLEIIYVKQHVNKYLFFYALTLPPETSSHRRQAKNYLFWLKPNTGKEFITPDINVGAIMVLSKKVVA